MSPRVAETFYDILGVAHDASQDDVRKAWLALARKHHPDKTGGNMTSEETLKAVNEAYDTLKRPERRRKYDEMLSGSFAAGESSGAGAAYGGSSYNAPDGAGGFRFEGNVEDLFGDLFGREASGRQQGPRPGRDLEAHVSVSLKEAATGTRKSLRLPSRVPCQACSGRGAAPGTKPQPCPQCKGVGSILGGHGSLFVMSQTCPLCGGRGEVVATPCPTCAGLGFKTEIRTLSVTVPAGVRTGTRLRLAGQGEPGAVTGDLFVVIRVKGNELFQLKRNDVICEVPITFTQAVLGDRVEVPTLWGKAMLKIPAGTQTGATLRMRNQGFPSFNGEQRGDQLVRVIVEIPRTITHDQNVAVQNLHESTDSDAYPKHKAFADNLKRWRQS